MKFIFFLSSLVFLYAYMRDFPGGSFGFLIATKVWLKSKKRGH